MDNGHAFARNLKQLREDRGLKQYQLAEAVGLRPQTVSQWESKGLQPRSPEVIRLLCSYFGCSESDLFGFSDGYYAKSKDSAGCLAAKPISTQLISLQDDESVCIPDIIIEKYPDGFVLQVRDDGMLHELPIGAYVYVAASHINPHDIAAVVYGGATVFCHLTIYDEVYILDNFQYQNPHRAIVDRANLPPGFEILGRLVWMQKAF